MVQAHDIHHAFSGRAVLRGVDLDVPAGGRVAVVGPNGAGKSTLLRILATLTTPDRGSVALAGHAVPAAVRCARAAFGYLGHDPQVYLDLSPWQNLELFGDLHGVADLRRAIPDALSQVGLLARAHDPVRTFSRGMAQRLGIARMLLHQPSVLLLDEPYTGLDSDGARLLDGIITDGAPRTVVMVTHELTRAHALCQRVVMLHRGVVALDVATDALTVDELTARVAQVQA